MKQLRLTKYLYNIDAGCGAYKRATVNTVVGSIPMRRNEIFFHLFSFPPSSNQAMPTELGLGIQREKNQLSTSRTRPSRHTLTMLNLRAYALFFYEINNKYKFVIFL